MSLRSLVDAKPEACCGNEYVFRDFSLNPDVCVAKSSPMDLRQQQELSYLLLLMHTSLCPKECMFLQLSVTSLKRSVISVRDSRHFFVFSCARNLSEDIFQMISSTADGVVHFHKITFGAGECKVVEGAGC